MLAKYIYRLRIELPPKTQISDDTILQSGRRTLTNILLDRQLIICNTALKELHDRNLISNIDFSLQQWKMLPIESIRLYVLETAKLINFEVDYTDVRLAEMIWELTQEKDIIESIVTKWRNELLHIIKTYGLQSNLFQQDDAILLKSCIKSILMLQAIS